jgi:hypothetical protein
MSDRINTLLQEHNTLAAVPLTKWTGTEDALQKRIDRIRAKGTAKNGAAKAAPEVKEKKPTIGALIQAELAAGNTDTESILAKVRKAFPDASTGANSVRWYASQSKISLRPAKADAAPTTKGKAKAATATAKAASKSAPTKSTKQTKSKK